MLLGISCFGTERRTRMLIDKLIGWDILTSMFKKAIAIKRLFFQLITDSTDSGITHSLCS